jgi:hypothetical protein|nr:MAG TPA: hypothetical protein [Caudoviricetes sp.]
MTDKEQINDSLKNQNKNFNENFTCENRTVIIDGVDVSKCKYFEDGECGCEYYLRYGYEITMYDRCEEYPNCDFKQLARKTQECENLKEDYKELEQRHNEAFQEFERLKQEYEEMKKKKEENETFYLREYANKDSECLELQHKLKIATEALKFYSGTFPNGNKNTAKRVLEQIESEEQ